LEEGELTFVVIAKNKMAYFIATAILVGFFLLSNAIIFYIATTPFVALAFGLPMVLGPLFSMGFYYVFTHEEIFPFARELAKSQKRAEKKWLKIIPETGKGMTVLLLGVLGGPILNAFSTRFFFPGSRHINLILISVGAASGIFVASVARGILGSIALPLLHFVANVFS
jgi:hypothetical protein